MLCDHKKPDQCSDRRVSCADARPWAWLKQLARILIPQHFASSLISYSPFYQTSGLKRGPLKRDVKRNPFYTLCSSCSPRRLRKRSRVKRTGMGWDVMGEHWQPKTERLKEHEKDGERELDPCLGPWYWTYSGCCEEVLRGNYKVHTFFLSLSLSPSLFSTPDVYEIVCATEEWNKKEWRKF